MRIIGEGAIALINPAVIIVAASLAVTNLAFAEDTVIESIQGEWVINAAASDSAKDKYAAFVAPRQGGFRNGGIGTGRSGKLGSSGPSRRGPVALSEPDEDALISSMRKIVSAESLRIEGLDKLKITYDEKFVRNFVPNPGGRIYSASGDELIEDEFGFSLSCWRKNVLVVETATHRGVDVVERYHYDPAKSLLTVLSIVTPSGREGIKIVRVFVRGDS